MKKTIIALAVLAAVFVFAKMAFAMTDYGCVSKCTAAGYQWGLCNSQCSW